MTHFFDTQLISLFLHKVVRNGREKEETTGVFN